MCDGIAASLQTVFLCKSPQVATEVPFFVFRKSELLHGGTRSIFMFVIRSFGGGSCFVHLGSVSTINETACA